MILYEVLRVIKMRNHVTSMKTRNKSEMDHGSKYWFSRSLKFILFAFFKCCVFRVCVYISPAIESSGWAIERKLYKRWNQMECRAAASSKVSTLINNRKKAVIHVCENIILYAINTHRNNINT